MTSISETDDKIQNPTNANGIRVYNTLSRTKEPFEPVTPGKVDIYLCGPTVYDKAHIGHMVGPVIFDAVKRYLEYCGFDVTWVVNITDVDDKLINKANERGISMLDVAEENIADYMSNLEALGVKDSVDHFPRATECMDEIIGFTKSLIDRGFAYESDGDVYFDVGKDPQYGQLSNRTLDSMQGAGGEMASRKHSTADFALWKSAKPGEPSWDSPWGTGRPGWHIECSAMSLKLLGESFDIHGGGLDLVFPHHENEVAQSECCHGKPMAKYWMHNGLLSVSTTSGKMGGRSDRESSAETESSKSAEDQTQQKMSRSAGAGGLAQLLQEQGGERIRFFLLRTHYRSTVVFGEEAVAEAAVGLDTFYRFFQRFDRVTGDKFFDLDYFISREQGEVDSNDNSLLQWVGDRRDSFLRKMDDDFNTGAAISELFDLVRGLNKFVDQNKLEDQADAEKIASLRTASATLRELSAVLGLFLTPQEDGEIDNQMVDKLMELIIELRHDAREKKDFSAADKIRDGLDALGISLTDRKGETDWEITSG